MMLHQCDKCYQRCVHGWLSSCPQGCVDRRRAVNNTWIFCDGPHGKGCEGDDGTGTSN